MRILVVDDEIVSRKKMLKILGKFGECEVALTGTQAVEVFREALEKQTPFELITLDIMMPEIDGKQVLQHIREYEKQKDVPREQWVKVFMVTSATDRDTIISCVKTGCDEYITKPFSMETVMKKLGENGLLPDDYKPEAADVQEQSPSEPKRSMLDQIIDRFKRGEIDLPTLPKINLKYNELVNKGANNQEIAEFLKQDAAISSKLISISNSSYYRGVVENKTVEQAINRLGLQTTKQTVDTISQRSLYIASKAKYSGIIEALWEHSLSCAHACQLISESLNGKIGGDLFTMGLLHDIGKLFLLQVVGEMEKNAQGTDEPTKQDLEKWLDEHHCKAGATLLTKWGFPAEFVRAALHHEDPGGTDPISDELLVVHVSNELVKTILYEHTDQQVTEPAESEFTRKLGMTPEMVAGVRDQVKIRIEHLKDYLG
jgi:HD-like signal output (HDOD) protein/FixJ family two-component response regulator